MKNIEEVESMENVDDEDDEDDVEDVDEQHSYTSLQMEEDNSELLKLTNELDDDKDDNRGGDNDTTTGAMGETNEFQSVNDRVAFLLDFPLMATQDQTRLHQRYIEAVTHLGILAAQTETPTSRMEIFRDAVRQAITSTRRSSWDIQNLADASSMDWQKYDARIQTPFSFNELASFYIKLQSPEHGAMDILG